MIDKANNAITYRGEAGDQRDLRATSLLLTCPECTSVRDVARCTLFGARAMALQCKACHTSTTSSLWHCDHGLSWLQCPFHRDVGFRCHSGRKAPHTGSTPAFRMSSLRAKLKRLKRLGHLGQHKADDKHNSIGASYLPKKG